MSTLSAPARFVLALAFLLCSWTVTSAQQIIEEYGDPLTSYKPAANSLVQDLRPTHLARSVNLDGTARAGNVQGAAIAANPNRSVWGGTQQIGGVRLATGSWAPTEVDIALPAAGPRWVIGRSFNGVQHDGTNPVTSNGFQGRNWSQLSQPELTRHIENPSDPEKDLVYVLLGADAFAEFKRYDDGSTEFKGKNGAAGSFQYAAGGGSEPDTYTLTDQNGNQLVFFGFDNDSGTAKGQLWKIIDPAGGTAYVGHASTGSTAISSGYDGTSGAITTAYDSEGRRYTYTYDGNDRVTQVKAEVDDSGWVEVAKVDYSYYGGSESFGEEGDLKLVSVTRHLTDTGVSVVHKTHYRYWDDSGYHATTNPGYEHLPKYVYESEGLRRYDLADDSTLNDSFLSASVGALESYASAYFEYNADRTIRKAWFNGECGCSGAGEGTYEFTYDQNDQYSDTGSYDTTWRSRTMVKRPDDSYLTQYFDEVGQPLHQLISDDDPSNTGPQPNLWITKVTRNASGQVTQVSTPANVTGYTHDDTGASSWEITTSTTAGLVYSFDRETTGNMTGFLTKRKHAEGTSGTAYLDEKLTYTSESQTIGDVTIVRPLIASRRIYPTETTNESAADSIVTSYAYEEYGSDPLAIEVVTTTHPAVDSSKNGSGSTTESKVHYTERGLVDFEKSTDGIITYREYTDGQLTKVIRDADTTSLSPPTGFSSSGTELHEVTEYSYDAQGRIDETTLPGGRITKKYYSKLADGRLVTLGYPKYVSTPVFHGPVQYTVTNHAGKPEVQAVVGLSGNTSSTALTGHIDETDSDPILAADLGTVESMTTFIYGSSGSRLDEQRLYHVVPGSGAGSDGTNYDATLYGYDDSGHRWRVKEPTGTIRRTVYDLHGRMTESWMGTNDSSFSGGESSGTDNMVKTEALVYDGGSDGGNGLLTIRTLYVEDSTTDQRVTEYVYDLRGRLRLEKSPTAPHTLTDYDNLGRVTATGQYSSYASIDISTDTAASEATNRLALSKNNYDEMGHVWKWTRHKIDQSDGSDEDNLESLTWFDSEGRTIKTDGSMLAKTVYDRLGRVTHRFTLARDNDSTYSDADDVSGDIVMEESQTKYDDDGTVIMQAAIERFHDDWGASPTTGALDTNADSDDLLYTAANLLGRIQITGYWFDTTGRLQDTVQYGTNGGSNFDRDGISAPARSATTLRTTNVYYDSGRLKSVEDPREIVTYYEYDDAGRKTKEVRNYDASVNSGNPSGTDDNVTVLYAYTDRLLTSMTADLPAGSTDQVTTYIYGTTESTPSPSKITTGHLRRAVIYPDSTNTGADEGDINSDDSDVVSYAYNAQGQVVYKKDQAGNVIEGEYDDSGRKLHDKVSTLNAGFDDAVKRISMSYDGLGRRTLVTQYDSTAGTTVVDEVKFTYEDWGNVSKFEQDRNSAVGAISSVDDYEVSYTFAKNTTGRNTIRVDQITMPSGNVLTCRYRGNTTDRHDTYLSRLTSLDDGATVLVVYDYLGTGRVVGTDYYDVDIESDVHGSTSGSHPDLDRFNRITTNKWTRDLATDINFYEIDISYDEASNITLIEDNVHSGFDIEYTIDDVNRLVRAEEGTWSGSAITSRTRDQQWTLDQVGNWDVGKLDLDGDGTFTGTDEYNDDRTHNDVNELTARDTDDDGSDDLTLSYDEVGNLVDDGEEYEYVWDAFGRLRKVLDRDDDSLVAEYRYNGLAYRISVHADTDDDGDVDGDDKWFHSAYNPRWQELTVFREDDSDPKEEYVPHLAGLDGRGGSSYIDRVVLRFKDADTAWTTASDGTLEEKIYYCQNWRADVSALVKQTGVGTVELQEWVKYSAYGVPFGLPAGDADSDGDCDSADSADTNQIQAWIDSSSYDVRGDVNVDGDVDSSDKATVQSVFAGSALGMGILSSPDTRNSRGFAGAGREIGLYACRWRVYSDSLGRWATRDPLSRPVRLPSFTTIAQESMTVEPGELYEYCMDNPVAKVDPLGLFGFGCPGLCIYETYDSCEVELVLTGLSGIIFGGIQGVRCDISCPLDSSNCLFSWCYCPANKTWRSYPLPLGPLFACVPPVLPVVDRCRLWLPRLPYWRRGILSSWGPQIPESPIQNDGS